MGKVSPPEIASGSPLLAISQAWQDYGATYVELYQNDVLDDANRDELIAWDSFFHEISSVRSKKLEASMHVDASTQTLTWDFDPNLNYNILKSNDLVEWQVIAEKTTGKGTYKYQTASDKSSAYFKAQILEP